LYLYHPSSCCYSYYLLFFFFLSTASTEIYTLSLHDALPISGHHGALGAARALHPRRLRLRALRVRRARDRVRADAAAADDHAGGDRKSTRLNSSHGSISYAVFCLKKKTIITYAVDSI